MNKTCEHLHHLFRQMPLHKFPFDPAMLPQNGIYVLFEAGESAHGSNRIVRIGTHRGKNKLASRLREHFLKENKDRSIFRKNIGRAILNRDNDPFSNEWELDLTTRQAKTLYSGKVDQVKQKAIENKVTSYMRENFQFVVFQIEDKEKRLELESKIISTVSLCNECSPSKTWLGNYSSVDKIRQSGLWLVQGLYKTSLSENDCIELQKSIYG